jgi:oxygen-independent coproporphyrinogen III oxidase
MMSAPDPVLLSKYDIAAPRYTSYPTVPYWTADPLSAEVWRNRVEEAARKEAAVSLYIHLPYCERLCTYCGCNKHITRNHAVEMPYIEALLKEWTMYRAILPEKLVLKELHLGGGTPTFFAPEALQQLLSRLLETVEVAPDADFGFEAHPWSATPAHLKTLARLGFKRISIGVQDFDERLMEVVNRQQTVQSVVDCTLRARDLGFDSVNYDLIYGLPFQTVEHIQKDAAYLSELRPDRIAFYSYAHVPWLKKSQQAYDENDLPTGAAKRLLYENGRQLLSAQGYEDIGMDHFALPHDRLAHAFRDGSLHRNFMGYTTARTRLMLGLGASAIGDTWNSFAQNEKQITAYMEKVDAGTLPIFRGHLLDDEDQIVRGHILRLMTQYHTQWNTSHPLLMRVLERLEPLQQDGLVETAGTSVRVTEAGKPFLRNICMAFDARYWARQPEGRLFSQSV